MSGYDGSLPKVYQFSELSAADQQSAKHLFANWVPWLVRTRSAQRMVLWCDWDALDAAGGGK